MARFTLRTHDSRGSGRAAHDGHKWAISAVAIWVTHPKTSGSSDLEMLGNKAAGARFDRRWLPSYRRNATRSAIAVRLKNQLTSTLKSTHFSSDILAIPPTSRVTGARRGRGSTFCAPTESSISASDRQSAQRGSRRHNAIRGRTIRGMLAIRLSHFAGGSMRNLADRSRLVIVP